MRRFQPLSVVLLLPALLLFAGVQGCGKSEPEKPKGGDQNAKNDKGKGKGKDENKGKGAADGELTELASTGWGTLTGTVTYDGTPPEPKKIDMSANKDNKGCHDGASEKEVIDPTWLVNKDNKGVENVIVFLKAPVGKFFKIKPEDKTRKEEIKLDQPHCAFRPHVFPHFATYYDKDEGDWKRSGQVIKVINDAKFNHNTKWAGAPANNPGNDKTLTPGDSYIIKDLKDDPKTQVTFQCNIHPWMRAVCWVFDHPYAARTDGDGKFTIKNVPAGVELTVVAWHEASPEFSPTAPWKLTVKAGEETKHDFKVKAK